MPRTTALVAVLAAMLLSVGCTIEVDEASDGAVIVGDIDASVEDVECAALNETLRASGVVALSEDRLGVFDVTVVDERAEAVVRTLVGDEVTDQQVSTELTATIEGDEVTVTGTFTGFDGPTQSGETAGEISFTCTEDRDPGGGTVTIEGQEVAYDLVICLESDELFEARAWNTEQDLEQVVVSRRHNAAGWQDRIAVLGSIVVDNQLPSSGETAAGVVDGLFVVRGTRVTADHPAFGPDRLGSLELTCGVDLSIVSD